MDWKVGSKIYCIKDIISVTGNTLNFYAGKSYTITSFDDKIREISVENFYCFYIDKDKQHENLHELDEYFLSEKAMRRKKLLFLRDGI